MKLQPLSQVDADIRAATPLPYHIRDAEGKLLLARGQVVPDDAALALLAERGATVDIDEVNQRRRDAIVAPDENLASRWQTLSLRIGVLLRPPLGNDFPQSFPELCEQFVKMVDRDADLLLYLALRTAREPSSAYGVVHSMHVAILGLLLARRLGWSDERQSSLVCAALTMNVAVTELQNQLANSTRSTLPAQRKLLDSHAADGEAMLRKVGIVDEDWLQAVASHHAPPPGPAGDIARLIHVVDGYTALTTARILDGGEAVDTSPPNAARGLFVKHAGDPFALMLVKEIGLYPPGCYVRTGVGETAVVLRRGRSANAPMVACLTNRHGDALQQPIRRDTGLMPDYAICALVADKDIKVHMASQLLYA